MAWVKKIQIGVTHNDTCNMAFGRPSQHDNCPRCEELKNGHTPRKSWSKSIVHNTLTNNYCFSVAIHYARCNAQSNPSCDCGKMSYTD